ncbi:hypothetical protein [Bacillus toyonensis]|uniref:hypothetical protein n=1 Tax=Bacillus toyonensis TaxID=155322 RepID=UPI000BFD38D9|nr:hypothetical protein [Bacillus toyonensis]PHD96620.1 hypothetical protein COF43_22450 [Bacillus toyonensis]
MDFNINIPDKMFYKGSISRKIDLNIPEPTHIKWNRREEIDNKLEGVYVVFDMYDGDNWCTPNPPDLSGESRKCLYVGEGQIKERLNANKDRYGCYAGEVIYYEIPTIEDRLLFEKILIKHYQPICNKENYYYDPDITGNYFNPFIKLRKEIIAEISGKAETEELSLDAESFFSHLYDELNWSLDYINNIINLDLMGDSTQAVETYIKEMDYFSKSNTKSLS